VKVFSISDNFPAVIMVENGYNLKEYLKGSKSEWNPLEERCPLDGLFFITEEVGEVFENLKLERPEEWTSEGGVWLIVGDYKM